MPAGGSPASCSRRSRRRSTTRAGASSRRPASRTCTIECDDVLVAVGQENAFPWIERDIGIEFDRWGMPKVDRTTMQSTQPEGLLRRRLRPSGRRTSSGPSPTAMRRRSRSTASAAARTSRERPPPMVNLASPEDGHPRVVLRQRHLARPALQGAAARPGGRAQGHQGRGRARLRPPARLCRNAALPQLRRPDGVHARPVHRVRRLRRHLPDRLHHLHGQRAGG